MKCDDLHFGQLTGRGHMLVSILLKHIAHVTVYMALSTACLRRARPLEKESGYDYPALIQRLNVRQDQESRLASSVAIAGDGSDKGFLFTV